MIFKEIVAAVGDFKFYGQVKDFNLGKSIKYVFLFVLIATVLLTVRYSYLINYGLTRARAWSQENLPVIHIQNGAASAEVQQPYKVEVEEGVLIIDTTGTITSLAEYAQGALLTKSEFIVKKNTAETRTYSLKEIKELTIDKDFLDKAKKIIVIVAIPIMLIGMYAYFCMARFLQILLFSLVALALAASMRLTLTYKQIFNVSAYAITASMLFGSLTALFLTRIPFAGWLYNGLYVIYLILALPHCKTEKTQGGLL
ncbi:MAG: DUF1189 domain-containing protein [Candidatus Omnitrophica bacterium]|nr:DUF1189 domain-containing protein [Candidatus Omnitrophota bacterium]